MAAGGQADHFISAWSVEDIWLRDTNWRLRIADETVWDMWEKPVKFSSVIQENSFAAASIILQSCTTSNKFITETFIRHSSFNNRRFCDYVDLSPYINNIWWNFFVSFYWCYFLKNLSPDENPHFPSYEHFYLHNLIFIRRIK